MTKRLEVFFFFPPFVKRKVRATESEPPETAKPMRPDGSMERFIFTAIFYQILCHRTLEIVRARGHSPGGRVDDDAVAAISPLTAREGIW